MFGKAVGQNSIAFCRKSTLMVHVCCCALLDAHQRKVPLPEIHDKTTADKWLTVQQLILFENVSVLYHPWRMAESVQDDQRSTDRELSRMSAWLQSHPHCMAVGHGITQSHCRAKPTAM